MTKANILLVDDRKDNLLVLEEILRGLGQNLITAGSGEEALRHVYNKEISVILMDVSMPGMSGFDAASLIRMRDKTRHIPIIFVTGRSVQESHIAQGYSLGGVDYILKPIVPEILKAKVAVFVELFKKTEELKELTRTLERRVAERTSDANLRAQELARSNAELAQFAHVISHDLQEPVRKIINFSQLLNRSMNGTMNEDSRQFLSIISDGALRMRKLIRDLLNFSEIGRKNAGKTTVDTDELIKGVLSDLESVLKESGAGVKVSPLPSIVANPTLVRQVFQNLILNAVKFRSNDPPRIEISGRRRNDAALFTVRDNGIGIEPEYWARIFNVFQRLHPRDKYPGSGIGLSICKKIVESHGGQIWVRSEPEAGSAFFFTLPKGKEDSNEQVSKDSVSTYR